MSAARRKEKASTAGGNASDDAATRPPRDTTDKDRKKERMVDGNMGQADAEVKPGGISPTEKAALVGYLAHLRTLGVGRERALRALEVLGAAGLLTPQLAVLLTRPDLSALLGIVQKPGPRPKTIADSAVRAALAAHGTRVKAAESLGLSLRTFERILARQKTT